MSETTSSPSVNQHTISRSSSLSSTPPDSAPASEPTSDEQPDLGAFTTVLREWTHLQPPPRIPIQIRSATSSTTPTYHAEQSVTGSEGRSRSGRSRNSRGTRSALSTLSSFTRPQSSSAHPDGSTVWAHAPIASYLFSATPTLEQSEEREEEREDAYTPSPPDSRASTALTVEIASETEYPSFDDDSVSSHPNRDDLSPDDTASAAIPIPVVGELESLRVDSRETEHAIDEIDSLSSQDRLDNSSLTSRDVVRPVFQDRTAISSQISDVSITSIQLQSQARPVTTTFLSTSSLSLPLSVASSDDPGVSISIAGPSSASQINSVIGPTGTSSDSNSTLMNDYLSRNRNPSIPRRMSDSSYTTNISASSFSLVSYQIAETPSALAPHEEESDPERSSDSQRWVQVENPSTSSSALSTSGVLSLKTQPSLPSTSSSSLNSLNSMAPQGNISNLSLSSNESPLPNPHSHLPTPEYQVQALPPPPDTARQVTFVGHRIGNEISVVDDSGTPDHEHSEMVVFAFPPSSQVFETVRDDEVATEPGQPAFPGANAAAVGTQSPTSHIVASSSDQDRSSPEDVPVSLFRSTKVRVIQPYPSDESLDEDEFDQTYRYPYSHSHTPRHPFAHTPRGIPVSSNASRRPIQKAPITTSTSTASSSFLKHQSFIERQHISSETSAISTLNAPSTSQAQTNHMYSAFSSTNVPTERSREINDNEVTRSPPSPFLKLSDVDNTSGAPKQLYEPTPSINPPHISHQPSSQLPRHHPSTLQPNSLGIVSSSTRPPILHEEHTDSPFSSSSQSTSLRTQPYSMSSTVLEESHSGYPHSLTGLHLLPTEPPHAAVVLESSLSSSSAYSNETNQSFDVNPPEDHVESDRDLANHAVPSGFTVHDDNLELEDGLDNEEVEGDVLPSLGYLDEALSFIAAERARWTAAREVIPAEVSRGRSLGSRTDEDDDKDDLGDVGQDGEEDWRNTIDLEKGADQPKRKRRRKRPSKGSAGTGAEAPDAPPPTIAAATVEGTQLPTPTSSPKKRRSKSAAPSAAGSSTRSRVSEKSGTMTPSRRKIKGKEREKEFLVPPPALAGRSPSGQSGMNIDIDSDFDDGGRTPTAGSLVGGLLSTPSSMLSSINLFGKRGKRVGRREREKEKLKFEAFKIVKPNDEDSSAAIGLLGGGIEVQVLSDDGNDLDGDDIEPREEEDEVDLMLGENDSISNMSLLKPPRKRSRSRRRKAKDLAHVHTLEGITGVYKSTPASPKRGFLLDNKLAVDSDEGQLEGRRGGEANGLSAMTEQSVEIEDKEKKKRVRTKRSHKTLTRVRSYPNLRVEVEIEDSRSKVVTRDDDKLAEDEAKQNITKLGGSEGTPDNTQRGRILALARQLQESFPEQRQELRRVITRIEKVESTPATTDTKVTMGNSEGSGSGASSLIKSSPIVIPGKKLRRPKKLGHARAASEGTIPGVSKAVAERSSSYLSIADVEEEDEDEKMLDPRGRPPKKKDPLIHVFVDHSNILIGLLSHLKRHSPLRRSSQRKSSPVVAAPNQVSSTSARSDPILAFASVKSSTSRPLPILPSPSSAISKRSKPFDSVNAGDHPIPLPSFATLPRSLPTKSAFGSYKSTGQPISSDDTENKKAAHSDTPEIEGSANKADPRLAAVPGILNEKKKPLKHLWHAALTLVLERGRPVTRRVVVASSPLYQPMEPLEHLGYELRIYVRVPDFGDGMDRDRFKEKGPNKSANGAKIPHSSPVKNSKPSHPRRFSGSTSTESAPVASSAPVVSSTLHPYQGIINVTTQQTRVKYREQGVDELLQLKLHQAIAATDDVPEGSTIVLATGDGNMGQFNEEGFLGPIRTALRRGWKVELYAWEDGLSRAWRREFGEGTEWSKRGMFRVIGMEEFAPWLVETPHW